MATAESEQNHGATILPFTGPRVRQEMVRGDELRRRIKDAGFVSVRFRAGPNWVGHVAVSKAEALRQLDRYPAEAIHSIESDRNGVILGA